MLPLLCPAHASGVRQDSAGCRYPLQISTGAWELLTLFLTSHKSFLLLGILNERLSFQAGALSAPGPTCSSSPRLAPGLQMDPVEVLSDSNAVCSCSDHQRPLWQ